MKKIGRGKIKKRREPIPGDKMRDVVLAVLLGTWVWEEVLAGRGEDYTRAGKALQAALELAKREGIKGLSYAHEDHLDPSEDLCRQEEDMMGEFVERSFWEELSARLGVEEQEEESRETVEYKPVRKGRVVN